MHYYIQELPTVYYTFSQCEHLHISLWWLSCLMIFYDNKFKYRWDLCPLLRAHLFVVNQLLVWHFIMAMHRGQIPSHRVKKHFWEQEGKTHVPMDKGTATEWGPFGDHTLWHRHLTNVTNFNKVQVHVWYAE